MTNSCVAHADHSETLVSQELKKKKENELEMYEFRMCHKMRRICQVLCIESTFEPNFGVVKSMIELTNLGTCLELCLKFIIYVCKVNEVHFPQLCICKYDTFEMNA